MKLATYEIIEELKPIPDADRIELALVQGWEVIVKKGQFKIGDICIYIPIDTEVDIQRDHFSFLNSKRIKTIKMKGVWSQGLVIPISDITYLSGFNEIPVEVGNDI